MKYFIISILFIAPCLLFGQDLIGKITPASASNNEAAFFIGDIIVSDDVGLSNLIATLSFGTVVSIEDVDADFAVNLYPNPTTDQITLTSEHPITTLQILDSNGREVMNSSNTSVDVAHLIPGRYIVMVNQKSALTFIKQ